MDQLLLVKVPRRPLRREDRRPRLPELSWICYSSTWTGPELPNSQTRATKTLVTGHHDSQSHGGVLRPRQLFVPDKGRHRFSQSCKPPRTAESPRKVRRSREAPLVRAIVPSSVPTPNVFSAKRSMRSRAGRSLRASTLPSFPSGRGWSPHRWDWDVASIGMEAHHRPPLRGKEGSHWGRCTTDGSLPSGVHGSMRTLVGWREFLQHSEIGTPTIGPPRVDSPRG